MLDYRYRPIRPHSGAGSVGFLAGQIWWWPEVGVGRD